LRRALSDRDDILIPEVIENLTTERLLVIELAEGVKVGVLLGGYPGETDLGRFGRRLGVSVRDIPPRVLLVGCAIGPLDGITRQLDPEVDALEIVARYTSTL
jgi:predicted unusual protein kinase regulating ubiquinone biosynthesis (AarF/ABC1/UbiB family)